MTIRVAINGYGRIGRCVLRAIYEYNRQHDFNIVAINDTADLKTIAHLTRYDSTHGRFPFAVDIKDGQLVVDGHPIVITSDRNPMVLPWSELGIDLVFECTGHLSNRDNAMKHIEVGAKKVLISAPGTDADATIVYGVNHHILRATDRIVSNASCTTNCLAPVVKPLHDVIGIQHGLLNTIHAFTKDQVLLDGNHIDLHRARAATHSIIPTKTGAAAAVGLVLPELAGLLDGFALRVPTMNVSVIDFTFTPKRSTTVAEVNEIIRQAANDVLHISDEPLVSCDFNHYPASAIFDSTQTRVLGNLVKVVAWYDNEWGFSNRMLDTAHYMMSL